MLFLSSFRITCNPSFHKTNSLDVGDRIGSFIIHSHQCLKRRILVRGTRSICISVCFCEKEKIKVKTIIVAFTLLSIPILYYFQQIFLQLTIRLTEHSLFEDYARLLIYGNVLEVVADTNGFGAGIGGLTSALLSISTTDINAAHNFFLEFLENMA